MRIICVVGRNASGKDTVARYLQKKYKEGKMLKKIICYLPEKMRDTKERVDIAEKFIKDYVIENDITLKTFHNNMVESNFYNCVCNGICAAEEESIRKNEKSIDISKKV